MSKTVEEPVEKVNTLTTTEDTTATDDTSYSTSEVCERTGASYRQLDYWCRSELIPGQGGPFGSGNHRRWTGAQIMRVQQLLRASRISAMSLAELADWLDQMDRVLR